MKDFLYPTIMKDYEREYKDFTQVVLFLTLQQLHEVSTHSGH